MMNRNCAVEISFAEVVVEKGNHRRRLWIRSQIIRTVAHHASQAAQGIWGKDMLIGDDAHRLEIVTILSLSSRFLDLLVGDLKARKSPPCYHAHAVVDGHIPLIMNRKIAGRGAVPEILRHHRIQVMCRHAPGRTRPERIAMPGILPASKSACRI